MTDYKDGDTITVNGKPCRIEGSALVPVVKRGPLGGEMIRIYDAKDDQMVIWRTKALWLKNMIEPEVLVETNIPPRPTFTPMTAGEAARLPDIVGRWVAFPVGLTRDAFEPLALDAGEAEGLIWLDNDTDLFLIEGVDL